MMSLLHYVPSLYKILFKELLIFTNVSVLFFALLVWREKTKQKQKNPASQNPHVDGLLSNSNLTRVQVLQEFLILYLMPECIFSRQMLHVMATFRNTSSHF